MRFLGEEQSRERERGEQPKTLRFRSSASDDAAAGGDDDDDVVSKVVVHLSPDGLCSAYVSGKLVDWGVFNREIWAVDLR